MSELLFKVKGGAELPVHELSSHDLDWYSTECKHNQKRAAAQAEKARRASGGARPAANAPAPRTEIVRAPDAHIQQGSFRDAERATQALAQAQQVGHLVAPAPICAAIPEGCSMALSAVLVDPATETYKISGKHGLSKVALDKISGAAGISWDVRESKRLDDGKDPHYCHYRAVGRVRDFDGTIRVISGEVEMDAREGSPQIEEIKTKAANARERRDPMAQIIELRKFLLRHAESKAKNRAIRSLGLRTSYAEEELRKPFMVAKVMFSGQTDDPELRKIFAEKTADAFLGGQKALYGDPTPPVAALPPAEPLHSAPPIGEVGSPENEEPDEEVPPSSPAAAPAPVAPAAPAPAAPEPEGKLSGLPADQDRGADANSY